MNNKKIQHKWEVICPLEMGNWYYKCNVCGKSEFSRGPTYGCCYGSKEKRENIENKILKIYETFYTLLRDDNKIPIKGIFYKIHDGNREMVRIWNWQYGGFILHNKKASMHPYFHKQDIHHYVNYWNSGMPEKLVNKLYNTIL